jgi:hypothetical protein
LEDYEGGVGTPVYQGFSNTFGFGNLQSQNLEVYKGDECDISGRDPKCSDEGRHYFSEKRLQFRAGPAREMFSCSSFRGAGLRASFDLPPELAKETADEPIPFSHDLQGLTHLVHFAFQPDQQNGSKSFEFFLVFVFLFLACLGTSHQAMMDQLLCLRCLVLEVKCKSMDL